MLMLVPLLIQFNSIQSSPNPVPIPFNPPSPPPHTHSRSISPPSPAAKPKPSPKPQKALALQIYKKQVYKENPHSPYFPPQTHKTATKKNTE
ncbi:predicted protein [Plenodomus lingam JN3]|uniref:Predicted protein n=1 Tax=Leptosphaeria maculans (strain JN3 / isolate v23.1.3 / race Av1-4-5-6-7-8) TaxID=985895 RepID=E5AD88_LEPMJ|nr:predicted protein [Plenodomus lingam JN3]CBY02440.1 predicted protein [Plenodomus lingam JN3]